MQWDCRKKVETVGKMLLKVPTENNAWFMCNLFAKSKKKQYFLNLDPKLITDNKNFWKSVNPLFSDKITVKEIINLTGNGEILSSDTNIAEAFNDYFTNVVQNLNIPKEKSLWNIDLCINPVLTAIEKYKLRQNITTISEVMKEKGQPKFSFHFLTLEETITEVALLSDKKLLKLQTFLLNYCNQRKSRSKGIFYIAYLDNALSSSKCPPNLKCADSTPISKKNDKTDKTNIDPHVFFRA